MIEDIPGFGSFKVPAEIYSSGFYYMYCKMKSLRQAKWPMPPELITVSVALSD